MSSALQFSLPFARSIDQNVEGTARAGVLSRFFNSLISAARIDAVIDARQRHAEAKVARYLERQGADRLTDSLEREIGRLL